MSTDCTTSVCPVCLDSGQKKAGAFGCECRDQVCETCWERIKQRPVEEWKCPTCRQQSPEAFEHTKKAEEELTIWRTQIEAEILSYAAQIRVELERDHAQTQALIASDRAQQEAQPMMTVHKRRRTRYVTAFTRCYSPIHVAPDPDIDEVS